MAAEIGNDAAVRNYTRWNRFPDGSRGGTFAGEISAMKNWLAQRMSWIDSQIRTPATISRGTSVVNRRDHRDDQWQRRRDDLLHPQWARPARGGRRTQRPDLWRANHHQCHTVLTARIRYSDGTWSAPTSAVYLVGEAFAVAGDIAITEINYHPLGSDCCRV
jgi:hypothetical protein